MSNSLFSPRRSSGSQSRSVDRTPAAAVAESGGSGPHRLSQNPLFNVTGRHQTPEQLREAELEARINELDRQLAEKDRRIHSLKRQLAQAQRDAQLTEKAKQFHVPLGKKLAKFAANMKLPSRRHGD
jgi:uncharacterized coiled-coil protein SlyX